MHALPTWVHARGLRPLQSQVPLPAARSAQRVNGGNTTPHFNLEKGALQGDSVLAYLFILALEVIFIFIKSNERINENIKGMEIFKHVFLYTAYADDSAFFLTLFFPMLPFDPPENIRKPKVF